MTVDLAIISATNTNLEEALRTKTFREDLYTSAGGDNQGAPIAPAERGHSVIINAFLEEFNEKHQKNVAGLSAEAMRRLLQYPWPGNVRELRNCLESLVILSRKPTIEATDLSPYLQSPPAADEFTIRSAPRSPRSKKR